MTYTFSYKREEGQNPYTGFMSFQHFRGEKLYSDIVVRPEAKMTETERVECYPVSADAEENGRAEGYYPDTTIVYIRVLWKEFEPIRGVYNYEFIENIIKEARAHSQSLIFRLMAHSTRASDDVPEWLKSLIDCPARPDGMRIKDSPTDPLFIELFLDAVRALGARFDADPTLDSIDVSLPGSWGEGYKLELFGEDIITRITDVYLEAFPNTRLICQCVRPAQVTYANRVKPTGWRGDGFGEPMHTFETYPARISALADNWKIAPVSFESYWWLGEWMRRGWDIDAIIEKSLEWHLSSFNAKSIPVPFEWKEKIDAWVSKMGYHFTLKSVALPDSAKAGESVKIDGVIENVGVAPIYNKFPLVIRAQKGDTTVESVSDSDITSWLPGEHSFAFELTLPESGEWTLSLGIDAGEKMLYLATDAKRDGKYYKIGTLSVAPLENDK